jgi:hypothetical protein
VSIGFDKLFVIGRGYQHKRGNALYSTPVIGLAPISMHFCVADGSRALLVGRRGVPLRLSCLCITRFATTLYSSEYWIPPINAFLPNLNISLHSLGSTRWHVLSHVGVVELSAAVAGIS